MAPAFLSLSFGEMLVVAVVALLVFGGRLPEVMRNLGRSYAKFRQGLNEVTHPIRQEIRRLDILTPSASVPTRPTSEVVAAPALREDPPVHYAPTVSPAPADGRALGPGTPSPGPGRSPPPSRGAADEPPPV